MKTIQKIAVLLMLIACFSCGKGEQTIEGEIIDFSISQDCGWKYCFVQDGLPHDMFLVINSQEELEFSLFCENGIPFVDFNKHSMLVFICDYGGKLTHKLQLKQDKYIWNIYVDRLRAAPMYGVAVLTPKLPENAQISYKVNIKEQ